MASRIMRMRGIEMASPAPSPAPSPALKGSEEGPNSESAGDAGDLSGVAGKKRSISVFPIALGKHAPHHPHPPRFRNSESSAGMDSATAARTDEPPAARPDAPDLDAALDAADELTSHRLEIHRLAARCRSLQAALRTSAEALLAAESDLLAAESALRTERHEHAETRARFAAAATASGSPSPIPPAATAPTAYPTAAPSHSSPRSPR